MSNDNKKCDVIEKSLLIKNTKNSENVELLNNKVSDKQIDSVLLDEMSGTRVISIDSTNYFKYYNNLFNGSNSLVIDFTHIRDVNEFIFYYYYSGSSTGKMIYFSPNNNKYEYNIEVNKYENIMKCYQITIDNLGNFKSNLVLISDIKHNKTLLTNQVDHNQIVNLKLDSSNSKDVIIDENNYYEYHNKLVNGTNKSFLDFSQIKENNDFILYLYYSNIEDGKITYIDPLNNLSNYPISTNIGTKSCYMIKINQFGKFSMEIFDMNKF